MLNPEMRFAVSTATFTETSKIGARSLRNLINYQEVVDTAYACAKIPGLKVEYGWRYQGEERILSLIDPSLFVNIHAPIWPTVRSAMNLGWRREASYPKRTMGLLKETMASIFLYGSIDRVISKTWDFAGEHNVGRIIVHPQGLVYLGEKGTLTHPEAPNTQVIVEPEQRLPGFPESWTCDLNGVLGKAQEYGVKMAFDLSHTIITRNDTDLRTPYELLKGKNNDRIQVIHLNSAVPNKETGIPDIGGMPISLNPGVFGAIRELYQQLKTDGFKGILVFEYFQGHGETREEKVNTLYRDLDNLIS